MLSTIFKSENISLVEDHIKSLDYEFSDEEKIAILHNLFKIANVDREYHEKEKKFMKYISSVIDIEIDGITSENFVPMKDEDICHILEKLDEGRKDWFIITSFLMVYADGKALMVEYLQMEPIFEKIGIPRERWEEALGKMKDFLELK